MVKSAPSGGPLSVGEVAILSVGLMLVGIILAQGAWHCASVWRELHARIGEHCSRMARALRFMPATQTHDAFSDQVAKGVAAKLSANMTSLCRWFKVIGCFAVISICFSVASRAERWMSILQTWVIIVGVAGNMMLCAFPRLSLGRPFITYTFIMAQVCAFMWALHPGAAWLLMNEGYIFFFRCILCMKYYRVPTVVLWNATYLAVSMHKASQCFDRHGLQLIAMVQTVTTCLVVLLSALCMHACRQEIRREIDATQLRTERSGLWNLLDLVCDVVVSLDGQLRLVGDASRLSAIVMLQGKSLQGMALEDLMPWEEDRETFRRCATSLGVNED